MTTPTAGERLVAVLECCTGEERERARRRIIHCVNACEGVEFPRPRALAEVIGELNRSRPWRSPHGGIVESSGTGDTK